MASETEAAAGNTTINYEGESTAVEMPVVVVVVAVDAAAAPDAGNHGRGCIDKILGKNISPKIKCKV